MNIQLVAVGKNMPAWVKDGHCEYIKRLPPEFKFDLKEINTEKRSKNTSIEKCMQTESDAILKSIPVGNHIIALDERGDVWDTLTFAKQMQAWHEERINPSFIIGGPDGLASSVKQKAHTIWSLSALTLPHPVVRIILGEQIYRAISILNGHPYHRA